MTQHSGGRLSALRVTRLSEPGYYLDGLGLYLQVSQSITKSWTFRYQLAGRSHEMGLGPLHTIDLATARRKARECRELLLDGKDPLAIRRASKVATAIEQAKRITFDECAAAYIAAHRASWRNDKHAGQWVSTIAAYASPVIGALPVAAIDTSLVIKVLQPIWTSKTQTANRLRGRIESVLDWATVHHYREGANPARWKGHLAFLLASPNKVAPVKNHPALPWQELPGFMVELAKFEGTAAHAVLFAILTACRSGEVRGAQWDEIDLPARLWTIPAKRMKAGREHRVPLSSTAVALLESIPRCGTLVFAGRDRRFPLSDATLTAVLKQLGRGDITVHGFRSTFRDWCAEYADNRFSREVCEHAGAQAARQGRSGISPRRSAR